MPASQFWWLLSAGLAAAANSTVGPCDIYESAGTPCVAAHSTVRAMYAAYEGQGPYSVSSARSRV